MSDIRKNKGKKTAKTESKKARTAFSSQLAVCSKRLKSRYQMSGKDKEQISDVRYQEKIMSRYQMSDIRKGLKAKNQNFFILMLCTC